MSEGSVERTTNRWAGADAVPWFAAAIGLLLREPSVLLLAGASAVFVAYTRLGSPPDPRLRVTRQVDDDTPAPGAEVTVRLTIENVDDRPVPDLRVVDGVPPAFSVVDGSPHVGTVLRAGESVTCVYTVRAERGTHAFDPVVVVCRSLNGAYETELSVAAETTVTCRPEMRGARGPPLRSLVSHYGGQIPTDAGGSGIEFYGVREYRPGDRANRIDWRRRARTGDLVTLEFREERTATVVLLVDARRAAYVRAGGDATETHAVEWSVRAAAHAFAGLLNAGNRVGVAAFGAEFAWLGPGSGDAHRQRARELLGTHPTLSPNPPGDRIGQRKLSPPSHGIGDRTASQLRRLNALLSPDTQVVLFSPLADDAPVAIARRLQTGGNAATVVSPDVTDGETLGDRLARVHRRRRIRVLRRGDVRVVDWRVAEPLAVALERRRVARR